MLVINQPVGQTDTNQPQTSSHPAWLPISEMAGTTHKMPSAQHFISKCLYHLCACLVYTWWTFGGVGQAIRFWHYGASLVSRDLMFFSPHNIWSTVSLKMFTEKIIISLQYIWLHDSAVILVGVIKECWVNVYFLLHPNPICFYKPN